MADGGAAWHLSDGVIGGIIIFSEDITKHKKLELELRRNAEKLSMVIRASKLGIWDSDRTNGRVIFDKHWCNIIGCQQEELVLTSESWLELIHPEDRERVIGATKEHELGNTPMFQCEYRLRHQEGHWIWVSSRGQIVARDEQGDVCVFGTTPIGPKNIAYESAEFLSNRNTCKGLS
jgi:PAS domain S-box-containing protein